VTGIEIPSGPDVPDFDLDVEDRVEGGRRSAVVRVAGELDITTVARLRGALSALLIDGASPVVVDLTDVAFLDSAGLGALVAAHKTARVLQAGFALVCTEGPVQQLLSITGLVRVFRISETVEQAFADLEA
jgi:anti-sigma B factor antagonist